MDEKIRCRGRVPIAVIDILRMNDPGIEVGKNGITGPCECMEGSCIGKGCKCDTCVHYCAEQEIACVFCKEKYRIKYCRKDWSDWAGGKLIQKAFPYLSARDRKLVKTQDCGCWMESKEGPQI